MKTLANSNMLKLIVFVLIVLNSGSVWAQGTVFPNNVIFSQPGAAPPGTYISHATYPGNAGGLFSIRVTTLGVGQYRFNYYGIAELYSLHFATVGLAFTPTLVLGDTPLLNNNNNPGQFDFNLGVNQSRYFAYWDNALYISNPPLGASPGPDDYDAYGWFRLTRTVSGLTISDSATAMGNGIVVGTYTAVPEPSFFAIGAVGLLGLIYRRKR